VEAVAGADPTPEFAVLVAEEFRRLIGLLPDADLRALAVWKMEGHSNDEVAARWGCVPRTVERRLRVIRSVWAGEVGSWWQDGSIHTAAWPTAEEVAVGGEALLLDDLATALAAVRGAKSTAKVSMRTEVSRAEFTGPAEVLDRLKEIEADLRAVGRLTGEIQWSAADVPLTVDVALAELSA
jgi:hypothetical protein